MKQNYGVHIIHEYHFLEDDYKETDLMKSRYFGDLNSALNYIDKEIDKVIYEYEFCNPEEFDYGTRSGIIKEIKVYDTCYDCYNLYTYVLLKRRRKHNR